MIIGESFSKGHSSLYGYEKPVNPRLEALKKEGQLITFDQVESMTPGTISSFKSIMAEWRPEYENSCQWYECTTLQEIMRTAGYRTIWVSNQSAKGVYDNVVGRYAELCDTSLFVGNKFAGMSRKDLDKEVIPLVRSFTEMNTKKNMYFIHLMGSHCAFELRYPVHFNQYHPEDYPTVPITKERVWQRMITPSPRTIRWLLN